MTPTNPISEAREALAAFKLKMPSFYAWLDSASITAALDYAENQAAEMERFKAKLAKAEEVISYNGTLKIIALREWFGGERYARDYEYLDQSFGNQAEAAIRGVLTHIAAQFTKGEEG